MSLKKLNSLVLLFILVVLFMPAASAYFQTGTVQMSKAWSNTGVDPSGYPQNAAFQSSSRPGVLVNTDNNTLVREALQIANATNSSVTEWDYLLDSSTGLPEVTFFEQKDPAATGLADHVMDFASNISSPPLPDNSMVVTMGDNTQFLIVTPEQSAIVATAIFLHKSFAYRIGCVTLYNKSTNQAGTYCNVANWVQIAN